MNVHLTPALETLVQQQVKTGRYNSASEVVREALRLFEQRERVRELQLHDIRRKIDQGWASLQRGEAIDGVNFCAALEREEEKLHGRRRKRA